MPKKVEVSFFTKAILSITLIFETIIAFFIVFYQTLFMSIPSKDIEYQKKDKTIKKLFGLKTRKREQGISRRRRINGLQGDGGESILENMPMAGGWGGGGCWLKKCECLK